MAEGVPALRHVPLFAEHAEIDGTVEILAVPEESARADRLLRPVCRAYRPYKNGAWCYEDGCIYRGLELLYRATGEARWLDALRRLLDRQVGPDGTLAGYSLSDYNIDNILPGRALLFMAAETGEPRYRAAADTLVRQLATHPRTRSGVYWHKLRYPWQIWLDGLYMAHPFQVGTGCASTGRTLSRIRSARSPSRSRPPSSRDRAPCPCLRRGPPAGLGRSRRRGGRARIGPGRWAGSRCASWMWPNWSGRRPSGRSSRRAARCSSGFRRCASRAGSGAGDRPARHGGNFHETSSSAMIAYALRKAGRWACHGPRRHDRGACCAPRSVPSRAAVSRWPTSARWRASGPTNSAIATARPATT
jgi:hypothetical protein